MSSRVCLVLAVFLLLITISYELQVAAASDFSESAKETENAKIGVEEANYGGGYGGRGGYGGGWGGGGGGGYGGGGRCRYGCCGRSYYGRGCRCCRYAGEGAEAESRAEPQN